MFHLSTFVEDACAGFDWDFFLIVAGMRVCFGFGLKTALIVWRCFYYCSGADTELRPFLTLPTSSKEAVGTPGV